MNGTLKITASEREDKTGVDTVVECCLKHVKLIDKLIILNCVVKVLNFNDYERFLGIMFLLKNSDIGDITEIDISALGNLLDK